MINSRLLRWILPPLLILSLAGACSKPANVVNKTDSQAEASPAVETPNAAVEPDSEPVALPPGAPDAILEAGEQTAQNAAITLDSLTQSVRRYTVERRQLPKTLEEVVRAGYIARLPDAPPGKKFALDLKSVRVVLVDR
jgi:hypothetical protein